jgi:hypothetical protein
MYQKYVNRTTFYRNIKNTKKFLFLHSHSLTKSVKFVTSAIRGLTKSENLPPCACCDGSGQKPQYGLKTLAYQCFIAVLLLIYSNLFLSAVYYCLIVFWCTIARMSELDLEQ